MTEPPPPSYRLRVPCDDAGEFRERFVPRYAARGIFVPSERPRPAGARVRVKLELRNGDVVAAGEAVVDRIAAPGVAAKPGMWVRLTAQDPGGVPIPAAAALPDEPGPGTVREPDTVRETDTAAPTAFPPGFAPLELEDGPEPGARRAEPSAPRATEDLFGADPDEPLHATPRPAELEPLLPEPPAAAPRVEPPAPPPAPRSSPRPVGRRTLLWVATGLAVAAVGAGIAAFGGRAPRVRTVNVEEELRLADDRLRQARLAGPGGDSALDHLLQAKGASPYDARVSERLARIADFYERLGDAAWARGDRLVAEIHFKTAILADPTRKGARRRLDELAAAPGRGR